MSGPESLAIAAPSPQPAGGLPLGASLLGMARVASASGQPRAALLLRVAGEALIAEERILPPIATGLHRLAYVSRATAASGAESAKHLAAILEVARRHNAEAGLTGALLHSRRWFAQVLEGERGALEALYARIMRDERHRDVTLLALHPAARRVFSRWSMVHAGQVPEQMIRRGLSGLGETAAATAALRELMATLRARLRLA
ncbi:BLUF domain-containing protein [Roseococcus sp. SDR]|uniref:BLUF domain-containing protein n=1 Tax=Roseococcus sp. SDR TaxID=2835532 RepID=UPI001BCAD9EE|nr:BLUF domain-containing protein [Roseococcus sp. SDR]MBS7791881.1 BLUF domain-containing protein [Roseococcus sp. SDR]MBV1847195.1 BLUF domain-containing protein [Roseococcus sp. SDR]